MTDKELIAQLRALVKALSDDLACEVEGRFEQIGRHPAMLWRHERDMENVYEARRILREMEQ